MDTPAVWNRPSSSAMDDDDPWDDTILIKAYEEANRLVDRALESPGSCSAAKRSKINSNGSTDEQPYIWTAGQFLSVYI